MSDKDTREAKDSPSLLAAAQILPPMPQEPLDEPSMGEMREAMDEFLPTFETYTTETAIESAANALEAGAGANSTTAAGFSTDSVQILGGAANNDVSDNFGSAALDLLTHSHGGETLYDVYKWKENADRQAEEEGDMAAFVDRTNELQTAADIGNAENAIPAIGTRRNSDPGPGFDPHSAEPSAYESLKLPGGLRRHFVLEETLKNQPALEPTNADVASTENTNKDSSVVEIPMADSIYMAPMFTGSGVGNAQAAGGDNMSIVHPPRKRWTNSFVHFLTMYGDTMILQSSLDEDDESSSDEEAEVLSDEDEYGKARTRRSNLRISTTAFPKTSADALEKGLKQRPFIGTGATSATAATPRSARARPLNAPLHHNHHHSMKSKLPPVQLNSDSKAFFILLKSFIGAGILYIPHAFVGAGVIFSAIATVLVATISYYGMLMLIDTNSRLPGDQTFAIIGRSTFGSIRCKSLGLSGNNFYLGETMRAVVETALAVSQIGFAASSVVFIANNLKQLIMQYFYRDISMAVLVFAQLVFYLPISLTRKIQKLSILAIIADVCILFGILAVVYFDVSIIAKEPSREFESFKPAGMSLMIGTIVFAFEGVALVLPIQQSMQNPQKFPRLLAGVVTIVASIALLLSALSAWAFGDKIGTIIWDSLPTETVSQRNLVTIARAGYVVAIGFTFPLLLLPATRILEGRISRWEIRKGERASGKDKRRVKWTKNVIRWLSCIVTCTVAYSCGTQLANLVALIGALCCIPLLFILPALFHAIVARSRLERVFDLAFAAMGFALMIYVTFVTLSTWNDPSTGH